MLTRACMLLGSWYVSDSKATAMREAYEAWCLKEGRQLSGLKRRTNGDYHFYEVQAEWETWQAACLWCEEALKDPND